MGEDSIYPNEDEEIDERFPNSSVFAHASRYGDYNYEDSYFYVDEYGFLFSFNKPEDIVNVVPLLGFHYGKKGLYIGIDEFGTISVKCKDEFNN